MPDARRIIEVLINTKFDGKGLQQAGRDLSSIQGLIGGISRGLVTGGAAVVGTLTGMAIASGRAADQMRDLSIRSGIQVDLLSELGYAAGQSGTNVQELADGLKFLNRNADDAARGGEEAAKKFARVGVSVTDANGKLKDSKTLLLETSDGLKAMTNDGERAAATLDLFGRSGDRLTEFLGLGSAGIRDMISDAQKLGVTVSPLLAKKADDFGDALGRTKAATGGLGLTIADVLLPKLTVLADKLTDVVLKGAEFVKQNPDLVASATKYGAIAVAGGAALGVVSNMATTLSGLIALFKDGSAAAAGLLAFFTNPAVLVGAAAIASIGAGVTYGLDASNEEKKAARDRVTGRIQSDPRAQDDLKTLREFSQLQAVTQEQQAGALEASARLGQLRLTIEKEITAEFRSQRDATVSAGEALMAGVAAGVQAARDREAAIKNSGLSRDRFEYFEKLGADLAKLNQEADRFTLPAKIKALQEALAAMRHEAEQARRPLGDIIIEHAGNEAPLRSGTRLPQFIEDRHQAEADRQAAKARGKQDASLGPGGNLDPLGIKLVDPWKEATDNLKDVGTVGTAVAQSLTSSFQSWLHTIVETGDGLKDLGKILLKSLAFTGIDFLTGGIFNVLQGLPFGGKKKGLAEGGSVGPTGRIQAFAYGGVVGGSRGHTDSVLAALSPGEIVLPPTLAKLFSNLSGLDQPSLAANLGGGSRSYNINVSPLTGSHHEALEFARRIRHALRELDGEFVR
jgi:hypothetical protein